jgi:hypothetical protein
MHSVYTEWRLCSKLSKEAIMLLFPLLFFIFVGLIGLFVTVSLSLRFHFRHNAQEQTFGFEREKRNRTCSSSCWDSQRLTQIFVTGRSEQPFSDSTSDFGLLFRFLFFLVHLPRPLSLSNGHISEQPYSSTNPELCHQSNGHISEQPYSSTNPLIYPCSFTSSYFQH